MNYKQIKKGQCCAANDYTGKTLLVCKVIQEADFDLLIIYFLLALLSSCVYFTCHTRARNHFHVDMLWTGKMRRFASYAETIKRAEKKAEAAPKPKAK